MMPNVLLRDNPRAITLMTPKEQFLLFLRRERIFLQLISGDHTLKAWGLVQFSFHVLQQCKNFFFKIKQNPSRLDRGNGAAERTNDCHAGEKHLSDKELKKSAVESLKLARSHWSILIAGLSFISSPAGSIRSQMAATKVKITANAVTCFKMCQ